MSSGPSRLRRLAGGAGGQAYFKLAMVVYQLTTVPLLIAAWGLATFGSWIALTAIMGLMSTANFGVANAVAVEIAATPPDAPTGRLASLVKTAYAMLSVLLGGAALALGAAAWSLPLGSWLNLDGVGAAEIRWVVVLVIVQVVLDNFRAVSAALIVRSGHYGAPNLLAGTFKLVEIGGLAAVVAAGGGIVAAAGIGTACGVASLVAHWLYVRRWHSRIDGGQVEIDVARRLVAPSIGNFILNVGVNLIAIYGTRIALTAALGPRALAAFTVMMTAVRLIDHLNAILVSALQHEFARESKIDGGKESRLLLARGGQVSFAGFVVLAACLLIAGPIAFDLWTHGEVAFAFPIVIVLLAGTLVQQVAKSAVYYLIGTNRVLGFAIGAAVCYAVGLGVAVLFMPTLGMMGAAIGYAVGEALTLTLALRFAATYIGARPIALLGRQLDLRELWSRLGPLARRLCAS
jgi:O-antigen/teichoic acid export membrane protein